MNEYYRDFEMTVPAKLGDFVAVAVRHLPDEIELMSFDLEIPLPRLVGTLDALKLSLADGVEYRCLTVKFAPGLLVRANIDLRANAVASMRAKLGLRRPHP